MANILYIAFKGKNNSSCQLVSQMHADAFYLTNSFPGIKRDIDTLSMNYEKILMFGLDKNLHDAVRFERAAQKDGKLLYSSMDIEPYLTLANEMGISYTVSEAPGTYLCNEAYWYVLQKAECPVLFLHIPSTPHMSDCFGDKLRKLLESAAAL